jgi:lysophospholipase L1-like esterase
VKKLNYKILVTFVLSMLLLFACEDRTELTAPEKVNTGDVDFSRFVSIGNSLTHGVQSDAVFETAQEYSFGNQIAKQAGAKYEQSIFSDPGTGGRLEVKSIAPFSIGANSNRGVPTNLNYPAPYNNLGIKWAFIYDALNARDSSSCFTAQFGLPNPLFNVVLRGIGTQFEQAKMQKPTVLTFWLGNNDILAHATRGGTMPYTPELTFSFLYKQAMDSLETLKNNFGTKVIVANIPSVTSVPYFTTVGPAVGASLKDIQAQVPSVKGLVYQTTGAPFINLATPDQLIKGEVLLTLDASAAAKLIGDKTGAYYSIFGIPVPDNVNTAYPFGLTPENPWPNNFILDPAEIANIANVTASYNATISALADAKGFALVDVNAFLSNIAANNYHTNGLTFTSQYVEGGLFSLDGIHPTSQGYAIIANLFIETINKTYNAEIPKVNVATIPGSLSLAKKVIFDKYGIPNLAPGALSKFIY